MRQPPRPRNRVRPLAALGSALALASFTALASAPSAAADGVLPVPYSVATAVAAGNAAPNTPPPGANDWSCRPGSAHPRPVVLIHGTFANERLNWDSLSPLLHNNGYCVFTFNYGSEGIDPVNDGLGPIENSAVELRDFVDQVLAATGVSQVDLVGHSQGGGPLPRYYLKYLGGTPKVHTLVGIGPTNHGGTVSGFATFEQYLNSIGVGAPLNLTTLACPACTEQFTGSSFLAGLNAGGDTRPGVHYTVIASRYDEVAPPSADFLTGTDVTDITLQDGCSIDLSGHAELTFRPRALALVLNALDPAHPQFVPCLAVPFTG
ncbi:esterase/lipase family protein [Streptomyces sp. NPDC056002]|uniref:esterase/lipase family protein n=1 Tax=Streptomyces sp. NPDC056002 TaxID=3345675 RepID=UPI0035D9D5D5